MTEGNKLIAEFMGFVPSKTSLGNTFEHPDKMGVYGGAGMKFKYNESWDWIMPVVEKIESLGNCIEIDGKGVDINRENIAEGVYRNGFCFESKIESTWNAVICFIEWYNNNKRK